MDSAPVPRDPACTRCPHPWHLLPCEDCDDDCQTSAWHGFPDPDTFPLTAY